MIKVDIIARERDFLVIDKPAGLSVHATQDKSEVHLLQVLQNEMKSADLHLLNRLDKETSGLVVVATSAAKVQVIAQSIVMKKYRAILRGEIPQSDAVQVWTWDLSDRAEGHQNPQGKASERKACSTGFWVCRSHRYFSEVECELLTGRQHQIRKHALLAGHPIVGDSRYNDKKYNARMRQLYGTERMFLHAHSLTFKYAGRERLYQSPIPEIFNTLMEMPNEK